MQFNSATVGEIVRISIRSGIGDKTDFTFQPEVFIVTVGILGLLNNESRVDGNGLIKLNEILPRHILDAMQTGQLSKMEGEERWGTPSTNL